MKKLHLSIGLVAALSFAVETSAQTSIPAQEIKKHLNDSISTSDKIYGGRVLDHTQITLLYVGGVFPEQVFTILAKEPARSALKLKTLDDLKGRKVTVTGKVTEFGGKPQIVVTNPSQLKIE